jgi:hypothetical protein
MENQVEKNPEPKSEKILNHILGDFNNRRGFRQEYDKTDKEVLKEMRTTLTGIVENTLNDPQIPKEEKSELIVEKVIKDLSGRRGLRQGFFDELFFDDEDVKEYLQDNPGEEVSEDESRTGIARQLVKKIKPFI